MKQKHKAGDKKKCGDVVVEVMRDWTDGQSFGGVPHYAVQWLPSYWCGWIPCFLFDNLPD
jgi:hypothetical protein